MTIEIQFPLSVRRSWRDSTEVSLSGVATFLSFYFLIAKMCLGRSMKEVLGEPSQKLHAIRKTAKGLGQKTFRS